MSTENLPHEIIDRYEVHEYRHAIAILNIDFTVEYNEVIEMLNAFTLRKSAIITPVEKVLFQEHLIPIYMKRDGLKKCLKPS